MVRNAHLGSECSGCHLQYDSGAKDALTLSAGRRKKKRGETEEEKGLKGEEEGQKGVRRLVLLERVVV